MFCSCLFANEHSASTAKSHGSEVSKEVIKKVNNDYTAKVVSYGSRKVGVVFLRGQIVMRLVYSETADADLLKRVQKISSILNEKIFDRSDVEKIGLNITGNRYFVIYDKTTLFEVYHEDIVFNGVDLAKLIKSWNNNINRIFDIPKEGITENGISQNKQTLQANSEISASIKDLEKNKNKVAIKPRHKQNKLEIKFLLIPIILLVIILAAFAFFFIKIKGKSLKENNEIEDEETKILEDIETVVPNEVMNEDSIEINQEEMINLFNASSFEETQENNHKITV